MQDMRSMGCFSRTAICLILSVFIALVYIGFAHSSVQGGAGQATLDVLGWSWRQLVAFYIAVALTGGLMVGTLLPIARRRWGAWLLGFVGCGLYLVPIAISLEFSLGLFVVAWLIGGPAVGLMAVLFLWRPLHADGDAS